MNIFNGYFSSSNSNARPVTYTQDGVRKHKPPFGSVFDRHVGSKLVTGMFVDYSSGEITDEFYGNCNDFNLWFLGKAGRQEQFDVLIKFDDDTDFTRIDEIRAWLGAVDSRDGYKQPFRQGEDGRWTMFVG